MVTQKSVIDEFMALQSLAVVGVSRNKDKFGNMVYRELKTNGYKVFAVNPQADMIDGDRCYAGLGALPEVPEGVILVIPSAQGMSVVEEMARLGIKHLWIQQGAESPELEKRSQELGLSFVRGECIFMFIEPVKSIHSVHRFIKRLFGKYPK